ncbi:MAG: ABC transporter substrate-binding protein [Candidatus Bathyarchaeota archaeon]|nr:ABC transporter substrate-binding protein [Candidatus Bathyarchaeota archaeon]
MNKLTIVLAALIIATIATAAVYTSLPAAPTPSISPSPSASPSSNPTASPSPSLATPTPSSTSTPTPTPTHTTPAASGPTPTPTPGPTNITVVDGAGRNVTLTVPINRIVSINSGLTEMLCALGVQNKLVGRDQSSTMPPSVLNVTVVGGSSYDPNVELILELKPDVIFADSMLPYNTVAMGQLANAGIPIFISDPTDPEPTKHSNSTVVDFSCDLLSKLASIVGNQAKATEYVTYVQYYNNLVKQRIATLSPTQRPKVMLEWYQPYYTFVTPGLDQAGGINIAENQTVYAPLLSAEFVIEQNPAVIIRMESSLTHAEADFKAARDEILGRTALSNVDAIKNGRVYICDWNIRGGITSVVGYLYWAKWCQPTLFADIDPAAVNAELYQRFFGITVGGTFAYP